MALTMSSINDYCSHKHDGHPSTKTIKKACLENFTFWRAEWGCPCYYYSSKKDQSDLSIVACLDISLDRDVHIWLEDKAEQVIRSTLLAGLKDTVLDRMMLQGNMKVI